MCGKQSIRIRVVHNRACCAKNNLRRDASLSCVEASKVTRKTPDICIRWCFRMWLHIIHSQMLTRLVRGPISMTYCQMIHKGRHSDDDKRRGPTHTEQDDDSSSGAPNNGANQGGPGHHPCRIRCIHSHVSRSAHENNHAFLNPRTTSVLNLCNSTVDPRALLER